MNPRDLPSQATSSRGPRGPLRRLLDLFSTIWTGIALLTMLFVYSSVGSAIPAFRQLRVFEMTEFEWFHYWPFKTLIALICLTLVVTTVRRIPFKPINYGVWMIHSGIIILALGSVWYFGTKIEGEAPVLRRQVLIEVPGAEPAVSPAVPGSTATVRTPDRILRFEVSSIDPSWEILSGDDVGKRAFAVNVAVQDGSSMFIRQLLAGYPQYTEDIVPTGDPNQPMARARKIHGNPLIDEDLRLSVSYQPQRFFHIVNSWALYLREVGQTEWVQRPIHGLPRYNDYFADRSQVWLPPELVASRPNPLDVTVPAVDENDPLDETNIRITSYLRYAFVDQRRLPGGDQLDPTAAVRLSSGRGSVDYQLVALDPIASATESGRLRFQWVDSEEARLRLAEVKLPMIRINVIDPPAALEAPVRQTTRSNPALGFRTIEGTAYAYRVQFIQEELLLGPGRVVSMVSVEIQSGDRTFTRWVFSDPSLNRDLPVGADSDPAHERSMPLDENIRIEFVPGNLPPPVLLVAGPGDDDLHLMVTLGSQPPRFERIEVGQTVPIDKGITLNVLQFAARTYVETRPAIVARSRRQRDAREQFSMVLVQLERGGITQSLWLPYHHFVFEDANHKLPRFSYRPSVVHLPDGRHIEVLFARQRQRLPAPVALEDFILTAHAGGFTGQNLSVRDWTSVVRFRDGDDWSEPIHVSVNDPKEFGGFWYFQAQWDPPVPQEGYGGMNYTVLGVGNRNGVNVMLLGCCLAVLGMIYAFYIKPLIKRRRQQAVYAQVSADRHPKRRVRDVPTSQPLVGPVGAAKEQRP